MGFLSSPKRWADGYETYLQYLVTRLFLPLVIAIVAYIVLGSIFMCWKGRGSKTSKFTIGLALLSAFLSPYLSLFYSMSEKLDVLEYKAQQAWEYKEEGVKQLQRINAAVEEFGNRINCQTCGGTTATDTLLAPFAAVIEKIENVVPRDKLDTISNFYATVKYYALFVDNVMLAVLGVCAVLVWSAQLFPLRKSIDETCCKRRCWYFGSITLSLLLAVIAIVFFALATVVSDTCNDYVSSLDFFIKQEDLNFYLTCDRSSTTIAGRFPPVLSEKNPEIINLLKNTNNSAEIGKSGYVACMAEAGKQAILKFTYEIAHKYHLGLNISAYSGCACNCSTDAIEKIFTEAGNFGPENTTGIWKLVECKGPNARLADIESAFCGLFPSLFAYFMLTLTTMTHVLFMYYFKLSDEA